MGARYLLEVDLEETGDWTPLCGHADEAVAEGCLRYFRPMAAFSGKPMRIRDIEPAAPPIYDREAFLFQRSHG